MKTAYSILGALAVLVLGLIALTGLGLLTGLAWHCFLKGFHFAERILP